MSLKKYLATACIVALPTLASSATVPLEVNGGWSFFRFSEDLKGGAWLDNRPLTQTDKINGGADLEVLSFDFTLNSAAVLQITDGWTLGDQFEVFNNGISLGKTSEPVPVDIDLSVVLTTEGERDALQAKLDAVPNIGYDWDAAFTDEDWSSGSFLLAAGSYSITGKVTNQPLKHGTGAVRLISPVPVPASFMLMLGAFGGCFAFSRYRNRKVGGVA